MRSMARALIATENPDTPEEEDIIDDDVLHSCLQTIFIAAEEKGNTGLTIDEFKEAMRKTVGRHSTDDEIGLLFMKIDANCDGVVDWEEYVTYNLLEYKEKTRMKEMLRKIPFSGEICEIDCRHRDIIVKIIFYPNIRTSSHTGSKVSYTSGKYMTLSKEGVLGIWGLNMRKLKHYNANNYGNRNIQPWFTDMVAMYNVNMLAITSTDRDITVFDLTGNKFTLRYYITGLDNCITAMDYWVNSHDLNIAIWLFGDTSGSVFDIKFDSALCDGPFGAVFGKNNTCKSVNYQDVVRGLIVGVTSQKISSVHKDWVNKIQYLPVLDSFLSSCQSSQTALFFGDFGGKKSRLYFEMNKGVLSFDYSKLLNIIVTGGLDSVVRVWNRYVNKKATMVLKGHTNPVNHVIINEIKDHVISFDTGRSVRVYELRYQTCLQHISGRLIKYDPFPISAIFFNAAMGTTLLGVAMKILMLEKSDEEEGFVEALSHSKPVVAALYSKVFSTVVSACQGSVVSVWDTNSGDKLMQFVNAHSRVEWGVEIPVEITALCFDNNGRRLVTGGQDGTVKIWNFNNGSLIQKFELPDKSDVTGIACSVHTIYVSGWGKTVYRYVDGGSEEQRKNWKVQHKDDILSMAYLSPNIIITGSYDGDIVIWSRDSGQVYCRLNVFESAKPLNYFTHTHKRDSERTSNDAPNQQTRAPVAADEEIGNQSQCRIASDKNSGNVEEKFKHPLLEALDPGSFNASSDPSMSRDDYDNVCKQYESAVEKILFLETREPLQRDTALIVTSGAEGWIRFWSMHHDGGLLGQFNAAHRVGESVLAIKSDNNDNFLFTGDTEGYVKIWDIREYCISKKMNVNERKAHTDILRRKFTFFRVESCLDKKQKYTVPTYLKDVFTSRPPPASSDPNRTLQYPILVNSFRAHTRSIHSVDYVTDRELLITGSADCNIRMWTVSGQYIGTFGGEKWRQLPNIITNEYFLYEVPNDIRRAGSSRTLNVMHGGKTPMWNSAIENLKRHSAARRKKQSNDVQDEETVCQTENKDMSEQRETSNILGKAYKSRRRHRMPPTLPKFIETNESIAVYHMLSFVGLSPGCGVTDAMKEIHVRCEGNVSLNKLRAVKPKKAGIGRPAITLKFNKIINTQGSPVQKIRLANRLNPIAEK